MFFCQPCKKYILVVSEQFSKMDLFRRPKDLHPLPHLKVALGIVEFLACSLFIVYCNICKLPTTSFHCSVSANISSDWSFMFSPSCAGKYLSAVFFTFYVKIFTFQPHLTGSCYFRPPVHVKSVYCVLYMLDHFPFSLFQCAKLFQAHHVAISKNFPFSIFLCWKPFQADLLNPRPDPFLRWSLQHKSAEPSANET